MPPTINYCYGLTVCTLTACTGNVTSQVNYIVYIVITALPYYMGLFDFGVIRQ